MANKKDKHSALQEQQQIETSEEFLYGNNDPNSIRNQTSVVSMEEQSERRETKT